MQNKELMSELGERWRNLSESEKAVYTARHAAAIAEWEAAGGKEVEAARRAAKKAEKEAAGEGGKKPKGGKAKAAGAKGGSKGPTGYTLFSGEKRASVKEANPDLKFGDIAKQLGAMWSALSEAEKAAYNARAKEKAAAAGGGGGGAKAKPAKKKRAADDDDDEEDEVAEEEDDEEEDDGGDGDE